ncbi:response regulator transcription factor [Halobacillus litoralis]|uniref:response regulator transcription factor n=1 Tax=Halobacillus litoralis TaxID=45668 RepID=UPI0024908260|nr:response regulator [Halobacillus litoralis]
MYKMIIAEDEQWIRKSLIRILPWKDFHIEVVGTATNGQQTLDMVVEHEPDILLTDIKMPRLNGIELIKKVRETSRDNTKIIIITGYNDYEYMKNAILLNVEDYLLKPIDAGELEETIVSVLEAIKQETKKEEDHLRLAVGNFIYENVLNPFEQGTDSIDIFPKPFMLMYSIDEIPIEEFHNNSSIEYAFSYTIGSAVLYVLFFECTEEYECFHDTNLPHFIKNYTVGHSELVTLNVYNFQLSFNQVYADLLQNLKNNFSNHVSVEEDTPPLTEIEEKHLTKLLSNGENAKTKKYIEDILGQQEDFSLKWTLSFQLFTMLSKYLNNVNSEVQQKFIFAFKSSNNQEDLKLILDDIIFELVDLIIEEWNKKPGDIAFEVVDYIDSNFTDPSLSLGITAEKFNLLPSYLSYTFKKEIGVNFVTYITSKRIDLAKKFLLTDSDPIYKISEKVGFYDVKYFNRVFKKTTGHTPKQYRNRIS